MTAGSEDVPRVSVLIPAYRSARYIEAAIASVQAQTVTDFELIIVDDGSPDDTAAVVAAAIAGDPRAQLLRQENRGLAGARNAALAHARAPYVALLDDDDLWRPTKLERQLATIEADPHLVCVGCHVGYVGESGRRLPRWLDSRVRGGEDPRPPARQELIRRGLLLPFPPCSMLIRRSTLERIGGSDETMRVCEDVDTLTRLANVGGIGFVPETLADYRMRVDSMLGEGYMKARREGDFIARRQRARLDGGDLTWEQFDREYVEQPGVRRIARSSYYTRRVAATMLDRRFGAAVAAAVAALLADPSYLTDRLARGFLRRGARPERYRRALAPDGSAWLD